MVNAHRRGPDRVVVAHHHERRRAAAPLASALIPALLVALLWNAAADAQVADDAPVTAPASAAPSTDDGIRTAAPDDTAPLKTIPVGEPDLPPIASGAREQRKIAEVIVTAQKTAQRLQDVPMSVTAVTGDFMRDVGANTIADVSAYIPNVKFSSDTDPALGQINIRGFGTSPLNSGFESSVGFVEDDLFLARSPYITDGMFDVDRVEVLRGPQGTLFGKNTTAGVFSVYTKGPTPQFSADLNTSYANPDELRIEAGAGGMFADWGGLRVSILDLDHKGGELKNTATGHGFDEIKQLAGRIKLLLKPFDNVESHLTLQRSKTDGDYWPVQLSDIADSTLTFLRHYDPDVDDDGYNHRLSNNFDGYVHKRSKTAGLVTKWDIGTLGPIDHLNSTLVLGYSGMIVDASPDLDNSPADIATLRTVWNHQQHSAEWRFSGDFDDGLFGLGDTLNVLLGGFYMETHFRQSTHASAGHDIAAYLATGDAIRQLSGSTSTLPLPGLGVLGDLLAGIASPVIGDDHVTLLYDTRVETRALFLQAIWHLSERWALTPGVRFNWEHKSADLSGDSVCTLPPVCVMRIALSAQDYDVRGLSRDETDISPKVSLQYFWGKDVTLYASYARGYKSGGFNAASFDGTNLMFQPENVESWEAGIKGKWFDQSLNVNLGVFYSYFDNLQTLAIDGAFINVANAATAISQGVEMDFRWLTPLRFLTVNGSLGLLDAHYDSYPDGQATAQMPSGSTQDLSGKTLSFAPKVTASLTPAITIPVFGYALQTAVDWLYQGDQYTDIDLDPHTFEPAHSTYAARISLIDPNHGWALTIGGSNLLDKRYATQVVDTAFFPGGYGVTQASGRKLYAAFSLSF